MPLVIDRKETGKMPAIGIRGYLSFNDEYQIQHLGAVFRSKNRKLFMNGEDFVWRTKHHYEMPLPIAKRLFFPNGSTAPPDFMANWQDKVEPDNLYEDDESQWAKDTRLRLKNFRVTKSATTLIADFEVYEESIALLKANDEFFIDCILSEAGIDDDWFSRKPKIHQKAGLAFFLLCLKHGWGHICLFDEMRTGKTKQAIDISTYLLQQEKVRSALVICPNTIKRVWREEVRLDSPLYGSFLQIIEGTKAKKRESWNQRSFYYVVNYEGARADAEELYKWEESINNDYILICDEAHKLKNPNSQQSEVIRKLNPKYSILLTGTPVSNRPEDIWSMTDFVSPSLLGKSIEDFYERFADRGGYNGKAISGYHDLDEIKYRIERISMRRLRKDVVFDKVMRQSRLGTMGKKQSEAYEKMRDELWAELTNEDLEWTSVTARNKLVQIMRLQQITSGFLSSVAGDAVWFDDNDNWKFKELDDFIDEYLDDIGGKLVIWSRFVAPIIRLTERYEKYGATCIYGAVSTDERFERMHRFQTDTDTQIMVAQIQSAGLGLGFQPATFEIFIDKWWSPAANKQAEDRIVGIQNPVPVTVISLVTEDTIDERLEAILEQKMDWARSITGDTNEDIHLPVLDKNTLFYLLAKPSEADKYKGAMNEQ